MRELIIRPKNGGMGSASQNSGGKRLVCWFGRKTAVFVEIHLNHRTDRAVFDFGDWSGHYR